MIGAGCLGPTFEDWHRALRLLDREGQTEVAFAIANILAGADPREEFNQRAIRAQRLAHRNRMLAELYLVEYAQLGFGFAIRQMEEDWRRYELRKLRIDRERGCIPVRATIKRAYFAAIANLGFQAIGGRQLRNVLTSETISSANEWSHELPGVCVLVDLEAEVLR